MNRRSLFVGLVTVLSMFMLTSVAFAQVQEAWAARYNGPGDSTDWASALAPDGSGNVYVTGWSRGSGTGHDYATIKYDASGNQLWVARYDSPGSGDDKAQALAVNLSGNVYVTGWSYGIGTDDDYPSDYATIKYDASGNQLWVARYDGPVSSTDRATALALDGSGDVYVTGASYGTATFQDYDYATVKYDASGNQVWVARYNGPGNSTDWAEALAVDAAGDVYVTGWSWGGGTGFDYATIKYDASGNELWVCRYRDGPANSADYPTGLAVDTPGDVYVTGYSWGIGGNYDYATVKYDASGNQLWDARYDGPGNDDDQARALALDASGNVCVTGYSEGSGTIWDYATVKYDASGNQLWVARYDGPANSYDSPTALALDGSGDVYVTGRSYGSGTGQDYATIRYDQSGNELWVARYNGPVNSTDRASALALDGSGNVYVTGYSEGSGTSFDYATIKYVPSVEISFSNTPSSAHRGETVQCQYQLTSNSDTTQTFDWWLTLTGLITRSRYLGPKTLTPHQTETGTVRLTVPGNAPLRVYTVCGYVGQWGGRLVWDQDCFESEVVGREQGKVEVKAKAEVEGKDKRKETDWGVEVR